MIRFNNQTPDNVQFTINGVLYDVFTLNYNSEKVFERVIPEEAKLRYTSNIGSQIPDPHLEGMTGFRILKHTYEDGVGEISFNKNLTYIGNGFLPNQVNITSISFPSEVVGIGKNAFSGCSNLSNVSFTSSLPPTVQSNAFSGCSSNMVVNVPAESFLNYKTSSTFSLKDYIIQPNNRIIYRTSDSSVLSGISGASFGDGLSIQSHTYSHGQGTIVLSGNVTMLCDSVFSSKTTLTDIYVPSTCTTVGDSAFYGCSSLSNVNIPDSVTIIGANSFKGCSSIVIFNVPANTTSIGADAFVNCSSMTIFNAPNEITSISTTVFQNCTSLVRFNSNTDGEFNLPTSLTAIGSWCFHKCPKMKKVVLPASLNVFGRGKPKGRVFSDCTNLKDIYFLGNCPTTFGSEAFEGLDKEYRIHIKDDQYSTFKANANAAPYYKHFYNENCMVFYKTSDNSTITPTSGWGPALISGENEYISDFGCCRMVFNGPILYLSDNNTTFNSNTKLIDIVLPPTMTYIGSSDFQGCTVLKTVKLPTQCEEIRTYAFKGCTQLETVTIPASVDTLYTDVFNGCSNMKSVVMESTTPPSIGTDQGTLFNGAYPIIVPDGCVATYKANPRWAVYGNDNRIKTNAETKTGYTFGTYIRATGSQWVDVGVRFGKFIMNMYFASNSGNNYMGCSVKSCGWFGTASNQYKMNRDVLANPTDVTVRRNITYNSSSAPSISLTVENEDNNYTLNDTFNRDLSYIGTFYVFAINGSTSSFASSGTLYTLTAYNPLGVKVREMKPCKRNSDGAVGLYDEITNQFIAGSGSLTFG